MATQKNSWMFYSNAGFQIGAALLLFGFIGYKIDSYFLSSPYCLIIGLLLGAFLSLYDLWNRQSQKQ